MWLQELRATDRKAYAKCVAAIQLLAEFGYELRRPHVDSVGNDLYELRVRVGRVHYRMLYFFHGRNVVVLVHAFTKEGELPQADLNRALSRKVAFEADPETHTYEEEL